MDTGRCWGKENWRSLRYGWRTWRIYLGGIEFKENSIRSLQAFLESIALVADIDEMEEGRGCCSCDLYNAKGLNFGGVSSGMEEEHVSPFQFIDRP